MNEEDKIPFTSHLEELRRRLIIAFVAVAIGFAASYGFKEQLFEILVRPLKMVMAEGDTLIFTNLPEAFFTYLKVSFLTGIGLASPVLIYQFWIFVAPASMTRKSGCCCPSFSSRPCSFWAAPFSGTSSSFPTVLISSWALPPRPSVPCPP